MRENDSLHSTPPDPSDEVSQLERDREALEVASRREREILTNMSHEIRAPMHSIIGMTGLMFDTALNPEQRRYVEAIRASADSLIGIINDISDFSKIEADTLDLEEVLFDPRQLMEELGNAQALKAQDRQLEYVRVLAPDLPAQVIGDSGRLRQVLNTLVGNAVKFTHQGMVRVDVTVTERSGDHVRLQFAVRDSAIGILQEQIRQLFDAFTEPDGTATRPYGGSRLGLTICRRLVAMMGGAVGVQSEPGDGSTFWFTVPLRLGQDSTHAPPPATFANLSVLVLEPHAGQLEALCAEFAALGCRVAGSSTVKGAFDVLSEVRADGQRVDLLVVEQCYFAEDRTDEVLELSRAVGASTRIAMTLPLIRALLPAELDGRSVAFRLTKPVKRDALCACLLECLAGERGTSRADLARAFHDARQEGGRGASDSADSVEDVPKDGLDREFDLPGLVQRLGGDEELAREVIQLLVGDISARFEELTAALALENLGRLAQIAHAIKGACANGGAPLMCAAAAAIETAAKGRALDQAKVHVAQLADHLARFRQAASLAFREP